MKTLHTFGCSISQGFALPDVVKPLVDEQGQQLNSQQIIELGPRVNWEDIHLYQPSKYAWPQMLANRLDIPVVNHARRGACFQQISRQCAVAAKEVKPDDIVIVMWTYLSRLSLQWPARTSVPYCNIADPTFGLQTVILGFNKFFGLERASDCDQHIQQYIEDSTRTTYLDPMGVYNRYYNSLVLQSMTDGFLRATGARVIHLSVETEPVVNQLAKAAEDLDASLREPYRIPHPDSWYDLSVDYDSCWVILDTSIPTAENDMHPSVTHHANFADHIHNKYFS